MSTLAEHPQAPEQRVCMFELKDSRNITNAVRGLAILVVVYAHFASNFAGDFYERWLTEYASSFIAVFFVLSGFGAYQSLERRFPPAGDNTRALMKYLFDRAVRVFPLYWLSMLIMPLLVPFPFNDILFSFSPKALLIWMGIPVARNPELWFVTAIIQCYWAAPLLYLLIRKVGVRRFVAGLAGFTAVAMAISALFYLERFDAMHLPAIGKPQAFFYKAYFLGNIILFALGMLMVPAAKHLGPYLRKRYMTAVTAVVFVGMVYLLRFPGTVFKYSELLLVPVLYLACTIFCLSVVVNRPRLPGGTFFSLVGRHSYALYLFHYQFLFGLALIGLIGGEEHGRSAAVAVAAFPILLLACAAIDRAVSFPVSRFDRWVGRRLQLPAPELPRTGRPFNEAGEDRLIMKALPILDRQDR